MNHKREHLHKDYGILRLFGGFAMAKSAVEKSCGAVVVKRKGSKMFVLIVRQMEGHWGFPKGHMKDYESEQDTAAREVLEETGVEFEFYSNFREETHYKLKSGNMKNVVYFMGRRTGGKEEPQENEISEVRWVPLTDAIILLTYDTDAVVLRKAMRYIKDNIEEYSDIL